MQINRWKHQLLVMLSLTLLFMLSGCLLSEDKAVENAEEEANDIFITSPEEPNQQIDLISLYLPEDIEIEGSSDNNIFLTKKERDYLLFYNQLEDSDSDRLYEGLNGREDQVLLQSFEEDDRFGYIAVFQNTVEDQYELQVGIGGIKITTLTEKQTLADDAEEMMQIVNSAEIIEE